MSVLVIGAKGNVGGHVMAGLRSAGIPVRGSSRTAGSVGTPDDDAAMVRLDLDDPATLPAALDGVEKVFLYARPESIAAFVSAARTARVKHVVLLSSASVVDPATRHSVSSKRHATVEEALRESGMAWTFLRPTTFANQYLRCVGAIRAGDVVRGPFLEVRIASIHERDIADVAVRALTDAGHEGQAYWLTGPEALTQRRHIEVIGEVLGRHIEVVEVAPEDADPKPTEFYVRNMTELLTARCVVTSAVEETTGAPARSFRQWAEEHVEHFI
ncbi:SDR family oxidoreductase [Micromonospora sp. NBS 11-29]|uniref:SDR family oxidoreductase n=1 Tax=Micromonospora sp. NBS 11-29 TaxID=1960879 RepID=UPI000B78F2CE|nr:NAD(P)H-binding protein [Micromonospora sp. NBS 11-29]